MFLNSIASLRQNVLDQKMKDQSASNIFTQCREGNTECEVCCESTTDLTNLECGHLFCKACIYAHLESRIKEGNVLEIPCLMLGCLQSFDDEDILKYSDTRLHELYERILRNIEVDLNPNLVWCPAPYCDLYVRIPVNKKHRRKLL